MDKAAFTACVRSILREFPPRSYVLDDITIEATTAILHIKPNTGFIGAPKAVSIPAGGDRDEITRAMLGAGLMQRQFEASLETHP